MNPNDELHDLWCGQASPIRKGEDMLAHVIQKSSEFDRRIAVRNAIESCAAIAVVLLFGFFAFRAPSPLEKAGMIITAASGLWMIYFFRRFAGNVAKAKTAVSTVEYQREFLENIDHQIRLLSTVKYWYLLPPYFGILIGNIGLMLRISHIRPLLWVDFLPIGFVTLFFGAVWVLNEMWGVKQLQITRRQVESLLEESR